MKGKVERIQVATDGCARAALAFAAEIRRLAGEEALRVHEEEDSDAVGFELDGDGGEDEDRPGAIRVEVGTVEAPGRRDPGPLVEHYLPTLAALAGNPGAAREYLRRFVEPREVGAGRRFGKRERSQRGS